ncbi:unnamed protein product, partial [Adineta steineri]
MSSKKITIGNYLLRRLRDLGIDIIFGVPGDYNLPFLDQIEGRVLSWQLFIIIIIHTFCLDFGSI